MCETREGLTPRNDTIIAKDTFWAYTKEHNIRADQTGHCICTWTMPWTIYAIDVVGNERVFLRHKFRFEKVL